MDKDSLKGALGKRRANAQGLDINIIISGPDEEKGTDLAPEVNDKAGEGAVHEDEAQDVGLIQKVLDAEGLSPMRKMMAKKKALIQPEPNDEGTV